MLLLYLCIALQRRKGKKNRADDDLLFCRKERKRREKRGIYIIAIDLMVAPFVCSLVVGKRGKNERERDTHKAARCIIRIMFVYHICVRLLLYLTWVVGIVPLAAAWVMNTSVMATCNQLGVIKKYYTGAAAQTYREKKTERGKKERKKNKVVNQARKGHGRIGLFPSTGSA